MKKANKQVAAALAGVALILCLMLMPGLPWSARCRHFIKKLRAKADMKVSAWQGVPPRFISLSGRIINKKESLKGAEVEALDSASGWASLTDWQGRFVLPDVVWYPQASYIIVIKSNDYQIRQVRVSAPESYPEGGILNVGELVYEQSCKVDATDLQGINSISYIEYDRRNIDYYKELFNRLTAEKQGDEEKLEAISRYVASKLIKDETVEPALNANHESPRQILEQGSRYCGRLALALATIAEAGNYKTRMLDLVDETLHPSAHVVTEIYYADRWHLYDPIIGSVFRIKEDRIASYKEVRLNTDFRFPKTAPEHLPEIPDRQKNWMDDAYRSGLHHYYCFK